MKVADPTTYTWRHDISKKSYSLKLKSRQNLETDYRALSKIAFEIPGFARRFIAEIAIDNDGLRITMKGEYDAALDTLKSIDAIASGAAFAGEGLSHLSIEDNAGKVLCELQGDVLPELRARARDERMALIYEW